MVLFLVSFASFTYSSITKTQTHAATGGSFGPPSPSSSSKKEMKAAPWRHFSNTPRSIWTSSQIPTDPYIDPSDQNLVAFPASPGTHPSTFQPTRLCSDGVSRPTIFVSVASYRDYMCSSTVTNILGNARHPERIRVAVVEQNMEADPFSCLDTIVPCSTDPSQPLCLYRSSVEIYSLPAPSATGPVFARALGSALYNGESYAMQCDAHLEFVVDWDEDVIGQHSRVNNDYAVLTTYLSDVKGNISPKTGKGLSKTVPFMCNSAFEQAGGVQILRHGSQPELANPFGLGEPVLSPYWAAGWYFSRGHFVQNVPYDPNLPMVFQGEEISIGVRGFTHGYDFYTPGRSVCYHYYGKRPSLRGHEPPVVKKYWENSNHHQGSLKKAMRRLAGTIGMLPAGSSTEDVGPYGLGAVRPMEQFYKIYNIDPKEHTANVEGLCKYTNSGKLHRKITPLLKEGGGPIDYGKLGDWVVPGLS